MYKYCINIYMCVCDMICITILTMVFVLKKTGIWYNPGDISSCNWNCKCVAVAVARVHYGITAGSWWELMHLHGSSCRFMLLWSLLVHWPRTVCAQPTCHQGAKHHTFMSITTDGNTCLLQVPHEGQGVRVEMSPAFLLTNLIGFQWLLFARKKWGKKSAEIDTSQGVQPSGSSKSFNSRLSVTSFLASNFTSDPGIFVGA